MVVDLSKLATPKAPSIIGVKWREDQTVSEFGIEELRAMTADEFRLFWLTITTGNIDDPEFVRTFKPTDTCAARFGSKCCVLEYEHDGSHRSNSGTTWE